ncbi:MAG: chromosomal replication initiator protein DnaA [Clostridiales bacterium]|uniref:Chromosomal replication initiator protein DnaA n=1 Tax=Harryflintia acetispora TaxID=1849041 RepID=A0A9X8ULZ2_9FIRM|nr:MULTISPECIES: chromosomal replication initiator protein DnaA [Oscillospiraceae]PWM37973.1 MAG: chromosomal replication initiator protein DnaA [Clostridiales bacterium]RGB68951.1 chromosomal replication initiator protein DnaA [Harryflintia acetispora]TCL45192.1 chromosomal replication initiator protein [Harryflintia acetispora]
MESFHEVFELVSEYCKGEISEVAHKVWIKDIEPLKLEGSTAYLGVKTDFKKKILEERYLGLLATAFENVLGFEVKVEIVCQPDLSPAPEPEAPFLSKPSGNGDYEYTFSTFIIGPSNKFAHAASLAVAANPASTYNPLFIYGASGLGKTHLLYAICNEIQKNSPQKKIIYAKGEEFTNELINAIATQTTKEFHDKYRMADVLLVDDIQFIGGKESTQEEFFHTFNTLYQAGKQIVLTSDRPPKEIKTLEDRLRTRFEWGLLADIQPPDFETRIAIIRRKAQLLGSTMPDEVAEYIANRLKNNIRQLEGAVKKIIAYEELAHTPPSILIAQNAIRDILNDNQPIPVTVERIISEVSRTYSVSAQDIRSNKRSAQISSARQIAIYIVREITQMSMSAIGEEFGGRDHSTIVYAIQQVEKNMQHDSVYKETIEDIIKNIRNN